MVGIEVEKYCCGNCGLSWGGICGASYRRITNSKPACNFIHSNFIDRGYTWLKPKDTSLRSKDARS